MPEVPIQRAHDDERDLPVFRELSDRADAIRRRAHALFVERGREFGHELDDWLAAEREVLGWPSAEVREDEGAYEVDVTLPGYAAADVELTATPSEIVLHAIHHEEAEGSDENASWHTTQSNDVYRRLDFPRSIDANGVTATFDAGMLHVRVPKAGVAAADAPVAPTNGKPADGAKAKSATVPKAPAASAPAAPSEVETAPTA